MGFGRKVQIGLCLNMVGNKKWGCYRGHKPKNELNRK